MQLGEKMKQFNTIDFGNKLTDLRIEKGETQSDIKTMLGYNKHQQVSYLENGTRSPSVEQIIKISQYYNVSADYLLGLTDAPTADKDKQFICDYTGLKAETVDYLHFLFTDEIERECLVQCFGDIPTSEAFNFYYRFIDLIIKNSECRLGDLLIAFKDYKKQCDEIIKTGTKDFYWNASSKREEEKEHIDIAEFKLNKLINSICDDLGKEVFAESETEALKVIEQLKEQGKKGGVKNG